MKTDKVKEVLIRYGNHVASGFQEGGGNELDLEEAAHQLNQMLIEAIKQSFGELWLLYNGYEDEMYNLERNPSFRDVSFWENDKVKAVLAKALKAEKDNHADQ